MNDLEEVIVMLIKHIRPDGYIYPFEYYDEVKRLKEIAKNIKEKDEVNNDGE